MSAESRDGSTLQTEGDKGRLYNWAANRVARSHSSESNAPKPAELLLHIGLLSAVEALPSSCAFLLQIQVINQSIGLLLSSTSDRHILSPQVKALQNFSLGDAQTML